MEYLFFISEIQYDSTSSLTYPAALRGVAHKIGAETKEKYISPSSPVFCSAKYRGGVRKDGGVEKTSKSMSKIPAFIGRRFLVRFSRC